MFFSYLHLDLGILKKPTLFPPKIHTFVGSISSKAPICSLNIEIPEWVCLSLCSYLKRKHSYAIETGLLD